jgi:hypothetical protein
MATIASAILLASTPFATAGMSSEASNYEEFTQQFCAVTPDHEHIFIVPVSVFADQSSVDCDGAVSTLRTTEPSDDPGHIVFNIDPPSGSKMAYDCDGKADEGMTLVGINCLPVDQESMMHSKPQ